MNKIENFEKEDFFKDFLKEIEKEDFFKDLESELKGDHSPFNEEFRS